MRRWIATLVLVAASVPATAHYVLAAHTAPERAPFASLSAGGLQVVRQLRSTDPEHGHRQT